MSAVIIILFYCSQVHMYLCPEYYCCQEPVCDDHHTCAPYRTGKLCGRCEDGYSESLFDTKCIPNSECTYATWFWAVIMFYGLLCVLFFIFEEECNTFMKAFSQWVQEKTRACRSIFSKNYETRATQYSSAMRRSIFSKNQETDDIPGPSDMDVAGDQHRVSELNAEENQYTDFMKYLSPYADMYNSQADGEDQSERGAYLQIFMYYIQVNAVLI